MKWLAHNISWMKQPVVRDLGVDIWCAAALLCQRASYSSDQPVRRNGHNCHYRGQTKVEGSLARIAASPTCVWPNRQRVQTKNWWVHGVGRLELLHLIGQQLSTNAMVCHSESTNIFCSAKQEQANRWLHREGTNTGASYFEVKSKPMAVTSHRYNIVGKLFVRSKPTAVTANKGVDIVGKNYCNSRPTAVTANDGIRLRESYLGIGSQLQSRPTMAQDIRRASNDCKSKPNGGCTTRA